MSDRQKTCFTVEDARGFLRAQVREAGSPKAWAEKHNFTREYIAILLNGKEGISKSVAKALGLKRVIHYEVIGDD